MSEPDGAGGFSQTALVRSWNDTWSDYPRGRTLDVLFERTAARHPSRVAIDSQDARWTYGELSSASWRVANGLRTAGVGPGQVVVMVGDRCAEACVAMLGILKAGATYLSIDDTVPDQRSRRMVAAAQPVAAIRLPNATGLAETSLPEFPIAKLIDGSDDDTLPPSDLSDQSGEAAHVLFTSGSTGTPKGVLIPHRGVARLALHNGFLEISESDRVMHGSTLTFDAATLEIWPALLNGACLMIAEASMLLVPAALHEWASTQRPSVMFLTTGLFHQVAQNRPEMFGAIEQVLTGGEVMNPYLARTVLERGRPGRLVNCYGPTENTVVTTAHVVTERDLDGPVPIGRPIANTSCFVLRADGEMAEPLEVGELFVGGDGLANGYVDDPVRTANSFVTVAPMEEPIRLYRTGDMACWDGEGIIHFAGRRDSQVKVRGVRIELDEIGHVLAEHPGVGDAAVVAVGEGDNRLLAAFFTPGSATPTTHQLTEHLRHVLPRQMLPTVYHEMSQLPLQSNGKLDRAALTRLAETKASTRSTTTSGNAAAARMDDGTAAAATDSRHDLNVTVTQEWSATLGINETAEDSDFFRDGGNSLLAGQLISRVLTTLKIDTSYAQYLIRSLLEAPRVDQFIGAVGRAAIGVAPSTERDSLDRWHGDLYLHPVTRTQNGLMTDWRNPRRILLTGATGFFGSYLLQELIQRTDAEICCLVRAGDGAQALERVQAAQYRYGHRDPLPLGRLRAIPGQLALRRFGWDERTWSETSSSVDVVYHCAAHVNFTYPYEWLRETNVDGVRNVIEFAHTARKIPVHYVSTIAVFAGVGSAGVTHVDESTPLAHVERISMGYPETKWVAEHLLRMAHADGLPMVVHRPYEITGNTVDGTWNTDAAICAFFKAITEMESAPDLELPLDFVPADYLASALVRLAMTMEPAGQAYHLTNPKYVRLLTMVERLRAHGHPIEVVPYQVWVEQLIEFAHRNSKHPIVPFISIFTNYATGRDVTVKELYVEGLFPSIGRRQTEQEIANNGLRCPPVADLLDSYIAYFHRTGYLPSRAPR